MNEPDWASIELDIECALLPAQVEHWLAIQRFKQSLASMGETFRILDVSTRKAAAATAALVEALSD